MNNINGSYSWKYIVCILNICTKLKPTWTPLQSFSSWLCGMQSSTRFSAVKFVGKDFKGYSSQCRHLRLSGRVCRSSSKHTLRFFVTFESKIMRSLRLSIFSKTKGLRCSSRMSDTSKHIPSIAAVAYEKKNYPVNMSI